MATFDPRTLVFSSPRPPLAFPSDSDIFSFLFRITTSRRFHHRLAIADASTGESLTFAQLRLDILSAARCLSFLGIRQHDVVLLLSPNSVQFPVLFFAIISLGAIATTSNPLSTPPEIQKQLKDSNAKLVLTIPELLDKVVHFGLPVVLINGENALLTSNPSVNLLSDAMQQACSHRTPPVQIQETDTAALLYSSGTTGVSKGVVLSHRNFIASALQVNMDADLQDERDLAYLCIIPMFHVFGLSIVVFGQLQRGNTLITMPKFDFIQMLEAIQRYRITNLPLVPPIMLTLAKHEASKQYDLSSVTEITCGAAPLGKETLEEVHARLKIPDVRQGYGMTETSGVIAIPILKRDNKKYASVGSLVSGMEAVVVDPSSGKWLPPNKQGELWVRGPNIMQGYLNNCEATSWTLDKDGWLHTGDLVCFDEDGDLFILDRLKELIKYKGLQVAPAELEAILIAHSEISDAAVVPHPDDEAGEVPLAYIVRVRGSTLRERDVIQYVAGQVAPYKKVRKVRFIDHIPKSASGKILRRLLAQQAHSKL